MARIRIDSGTTIINGQTLTFQSPADCSQVDGLIVYYPEGNTTTSKSFKFVDAHGVDVGSSTISLFAENVLVKVVLDIDEGKAYVQNADTNAYLEGKLAEKYSPQNKPSASDIGLTTEDFTFTLDDDTSVEKAIYVDEDGASSSKNKGLICKINEGISVIDTGLTYTRGVVEVRRIGSVLWLIDSGVYNFTDAFKTTNNRTVLQFDLPKALSDKIHNVNGVYGTTGTIGYFPALAYENVTYTTFNCQSYLKRSAIGSEYDTFQLVYTGLNSVNGGGLCGFHLKMPILLVDAEE